MLYAIEKNARYPAFRVLLEDKEQKKYLVNEAERAGTALLLALRRTCSVDLKYSKITTELGHGKVVLALAFLARISKKAKEQ